MKNKINILTLRSLLVGLTYVSLVYSKGLGIMATTFTLLILFIFILSFKDAGKFQLKKGHMFLISIILLALTFSFQSSQMLLLYNGKVIFFIFIVYSIYLLSNQPFTFELNTITLILNRIFLPLSEFAIVFKLMLPKKFFTQSISDRTKAVLIGITVSVPILLIMIALLASADEVFRSLFLFENLEFKIDDDILPQIMLFIFTSFYFFSFFFHILYSDRERKIHNPSRKVKSDSIILDKNDSKSKEIIIRTVLVVMNLLFILFTFIQFRYLFSSSTFDNTTFTYSAYARKGFFELTLISIINLSAIITLLKYFKDKINKVLMFILISNTIVIAFSALFRMNLYINTYGYTWLRVISSGFIIIQCLLLTITMIYIYYDKYNIKVIIATIYLISYLTLNYVNVDSIIVHGNINRYLNGSDLDIIYLEDLSYRSLKTLIHYEELLDAPEHKPAKLELSKIIQQKKYDLRNLNTKWYHFNLSEYLSK